MSITTYSELQTAAGNWLTRSNLTDRIPEFIALCEADFNRRLRIRAMEQYSTSAITTAQGVTTAALPTGWLGGKSLWLNGTDPKQVIRYVTPDQMHTLYVQTTTDKPKVYTIVGENAEFGPTPDAAYAVAALFWKKLDALSSTTTTNWMITNAPDVYLYGTLVQAMPFLRHDSRIAVWSSLYEKALEDVRKADQWDRFSGGTLTIQTDTGNP